MRAYIGKSWQCQPVDCPGTIVSRLTYTRASPFGYRIGALTVSVFVSRTVWGGRPFYVYAADTTASRQRTAM